MALDTVQDYVDNARVLLQDTVATYRYSSEELVDALNLAILELIRVRPDVCFKLLRTSVLEFSAGSLSAAVTIDPRYRPAVLYFIVGHAQLRDEEDVQGERAAALLNGFLSRLSGIGVAK